MFSILWGVRKFLIILPALFFMGVYSAQTESSNTCSSELAEGTAHVCVFYDGILPKSITVKTGTKIIFRNESETLKSGKPTNIRAKRRGMQIAFDNNKGMEGPVFGRAEYDAGVFNDSKKITYKNKETGDTGLINVVSPQTYQIYKEAVASAQANVKNFSVKTADKKKQVKQVSAHDKPQGTKTEPASLTVEPKTPLTFTWSFTDADKCSAYARPIKNGKPQYRIIEKGNTWNSNGAKLDAVGTKDITVSHSALYVIRCYKTEDKIQRLKGERNLVVNVRQELPTLEFFSTDRNDGKYVLGDKVNLMWRVINATQEDFISCSVASNGEYDSARTSDPTFLATSITGTAIGEPILREVTYTATCKLKKPKAKSISSKVKVSVSYPDKPLIRELKILTPTGSRAGEEQVIRYITDFNSGMGLDCTGADIRLGNARRAQDDFTYTYAMYAKMEMPFRPNKSGRCIFTAKNNQRNKVTETIEFAVTGEPPPDPKQFSVSGISWPKKASPGDVQELKYRVGGYYVTPDNLSSITDTLKGDVNCIKAYMGGEMFEVPGDSYAKDVIIKFRPGKSAKCAYEVRSRPTGNSERIIFNLTVVPPTPPVIQNVLVLRPDGIEPHSTQYIDFIVGAEEYKMVPKNPNDLCTPALFEPSLDPNEPTSLREYKDPDIDYYTHVTWAIRSEKSITCIIEATTGNRVLRKPVDINYQSEGQDSVIKMTIPMDSPNSQSLVGNLPNSLYLDQKQITEQSGSLDGNVSRVLQVSPLLHVSPLLQVSPFEEGIIRGPR